MKICRDNINLNITAILINFFISNLQKSKNIWIKKTMSINFKDINKNHWMLYYFQQMCFSYKILIPFSYHLSPIVISYLSQDEIQISWNKNRKTHKMETKEEFNLRVIKSGTDSYRIENFKLE